MPTENELSGAREGLATPTVAEVVDHLRIKYALDQVAGPTYDSVPIDFVDRLFHSTEYQPMPHPEFPGLPCSMRYRIIGSISHGYQVADQLKEMPLNRGTERVFTLGWQGPEGVVEKTFKLWPDDEHFHLQSEPISIRTEV